MSFLCKESIKLLKKVPSLPLSLSLPLILSLPLLIPTQNDICPPEDFQGYDYHVSCQISPEGMAVGTTGNEDVNKVYFSVVISQKELESFPE